ncbi:NucA/NucB deoxyribonuclease domain-containing protein [Streptomyces flavidovirens]|uniref:golvesin C-terminal-like domain-containing protein n=1 Tax=Streptomyces flavidovirens TaxID=67298 RepID=UPI0012FEF85B|nr:hypothetical protein [Streptomyces flavidovirens]
MLGRDWKESADRAWTTTGDATGFHILTADQKAGYAWRTAATLSEPGFDTDMWIGNACVTGSGKRAVVAYAPRSFTNKPELMARGAFTAVVDLGSGAVTKLDRQASLAYFSPGCGTGETAVFTQAGGESKNATRLLTVDASTANLGRTVELQGQVTSAVPIGKDIVAADAARLTRIDPSGRRVALAHTSQVPFGLTVDSDGGVVYMDRPADSGTEGEVRRITAADISHADATKAKPAVLARGPLTKMDLSASADGEVFVTGETQAAQPLPKSVTRWPDVPKGAAASTNGDALITSVTLAHGKDPRTPQGAAPKVAGIDVRVLKTGRTAAFSLTPSAPESAHPGGGASLSPALSAPAAGAHSAKAAALAAGGTDEPERYCSVPRNNTGKQAMQPKPRQVEWAVDQAITGNLNKHISRPANWKNLGMGAYQPQSLFPLKGLEGGGRVPAQVMLGITAQESNMWQASRVVVPGVTGNPLIGNYYGIKYSSGGTQDDPWAIDWAEADCGYGITQVTDGMRMHGREKPGEKPLSALQQEAVALDYTANVAAGVNILVDKWNQTRKDGLTANGGDPKYLENWFFALWAYNAGYYPKASAGANGGMWGVGYTNNPANPLWKANRTPFLESPSGGNDYSQAAHPQDWPYQEKVLGWAARPLEGLESPGNMVSGFRPAWWTNDALRTKMKPAEGLFCTTANNCDASKIGPNDQNEPGLGACNRADLKCWWNQPVKWKDCTKAECGNEILRFNDTFAEEADGTAYPPNCSTQGLPANALIVDDTPNSYASPRGGCSLLKPSAGTFDLDFASPSARIDFQQLGAGYGGHFWYAHTRKPGADGGRMKVTGTWKLDKPMTGAAEVLVHLPDHGAHTTQAAYDIKSIARTTRKVISQPGMANRWVSLGIQNFKGVIPEVSLSSETPDGTGDQDIAFDAVAFAPKTTTGGVPQLVLQNADPNAPDVVFGEAARPIPANRASAFKSPANNCRPVPGVAGREMCIQTTSLEGQALPNSRGPGARAAALTCSTGIEMSSYNRFQACAVTKLKLILFENNVPVGTGEFVVDHDIRLTATKTEIYQALNIKPVEIQPQLGTVSLDLNFICGGACSTEPPISVIDGVWTAGQTHTATITSKSKWVSSDPTKKVHDFLDLKWSVTATAVGGKAKSVPHTWTKDALTVRCDNEVGGNPGCVFPSYIPDFELNYEKYPVAASLYWVIWKKLQGGNFPGNKDKNSPLTRLASDAAAKTNRSRMCSKSATNFVPNPAGASCDEYPFAKSRQSGGLKTDASGVPLKGTACAQFSAVQNTQTKKWSLHYDSNYALPTWNEPCGRGSIPTQQNTDAGGDLGRFTVEVRLIDSDPYYPVVPELENCKVEEVCTVMPRP